jgi:hypothetical protein
MEKKDIWIILIALLGWGWGIVQFIINRRNQKKDKLVERRFQAYSEYMRKSDEIMTNIRNDPNMIYGVSSEFLESVLSGNDQEIETALIKFNEKILEFVKRATEPLLILKQELNSLLIICSEDLVIKIEEFNLLATDFNNEMQNTLKIISPSDSDNMVKQLKTIGKNERWTRFQSLNKEIISLMRQELGLK